MASSQATDANAGISPTRNVQQYRNKLKKKEKGNFECYISNLSLSDQEGTRFETATARAAEISRWFNLLQSITIKDLF